MSGTRTQWVVGIGSGLAVAGIIALLAIGKERLFPTPAKPSADRTVEIAAPKPLTVVEILRNQFALPEYHFGGWDAYLQLEREIAEKYKAEKRFSATDTSLEATKLANEIFGIESLSNLFNVAGALGFNIVSIENKGDAADRNVTLFIRGIRFADIPKSLKPNVQREKDLIQIGIIRPGDKISIRLWTDDYLISGNSDRIRASSDAGLIVVSFR